MISETVRRELEAIGADNESGASTLTQRTVGLFMLYFMTTDRRTRCYRELKALANDVGAAQPGMASVANAGWMCAEGLRRASWRRYEAFLQGLKVNLMEAKGRVGTAGADLVPSRAKVVTLSFSNNVLEVLKRAKENISNVVALESRPGFEGRNMALDLSEAGIPTTLVTDAAGPSEVSGADLILLGGDALLSDGTLVNKVGTLSLALAGREFGVPSWAALEAIKIDASHSMKEPPALKEGPSSEVLATPLPAVMMRNRYYDIVPAALLKGVAWEGGSAKPTALAKRFADTSSLLQFYYRELPGPTPNPPPRRIDPGERAL